MKKIKSDVTEHNCEDGGGSCTCVHAYMVCMHVYLCGIYVYVGICVHVYAYVHTCVSMCKYVCVPLCVFERKREIAGKRVVKLGLFDLMMFK